MLQENSIYYGCHVLWNISRKIMLSKALRHSTELWKAPTVNLILAEQTASPNYTSNRFGTANMAPPCSFIIVKCSTMHGIIFVFAIVVSWQTNQQTKSRKINKNTNKNIFSLYYIQASDVNGWNFYNHLAVRFCYFLFVFFLFIYFFI